MEAIKSDLRKALDKLNIKELNDIQNASLKANEEFNDVVLLAPTGSGKTLGFLLPVLKILESKIKGIQALVLVPSRELAIQIEQVFKTMGTGFKVNCFYGGHPFKTEKDTLNHPPALLIGTPGRIADHLRRGTFSPETIKTLILDEFDKSLEFGFEEDMKFITAQLPSVEKRILTSATKMPEIPAFTGIKKAKELNYLIDEAPKGLTLKYVRATGDDKLESLFRLLCKVGNAPTLVFCNHRDAVDRISKLLSQKGIKHDTFHGGLEQEERERSLAKFRNGSYRILISTDLASRGLDIPAIENVIHYQLTPSPESFVHRNGRTARMYANGTAYLILSEKEHIPEYVKELPEEVSIEGESEIPSNPEWTTIYIGGGKKDKISKGDIAGLLMQKGNLDKEDLGLIEVQDLSSYVAVNSRKAAKAVELVRNEKLKKKKVKIDLSR